tara:strand:- start:736 stop:1026 length:291 start_codon:yes stop_codon:yes gene_type:complete
VLADATLSCGDDFGGDLRFCLLIKFKNALRLKLLFCGFTLGGEGVLVEPTLVRRDDDLPGVQFMGELGGGGDFGFFAVLMIDSFELDFLLLDIVLY